MPIFQQCFNFADKIGVWELAVYYLHTRRHTYTQTHKSIKGIVMQEIVGAPLVLAQIMA